nr:chloride channel [uncultured archaeon GZfos23H7]
MDKEVMVRPEIVIKGGLKQYKEDKLKDKVFRRKDDKPRFEVKALPQSGEKVEVDIFRNGNTPIKTLEAKKKSGKIYEAIWADWKSSEWSDSEIPDKIPVGVYKAKAKVTKSGTELTSSGKKEFYVIFNDIGINGHYIEGKEGYNYYGGNEHPEPTPDLGNLIVYSLHIYNPKIFDVAIETVDGQSSAKEAANLLRSKVTDIIGYSTPNPTRSTLNYDGTQSGQPGQCMDYANLLTAYIRTVGTPTRPITTTDVDGWNFHEWTEAWLPEVGSSKPTDKWSVLDSTDGSHYESDAVIPHNYWIAHTPDYGPGGGDPSPWHSRVYIYNASSSSKSDVRYVHYEVDPPLPTYNCSIKIYPTTKSSYTIGEDITINVEFKNDGGTDRTIEYNTTVTQLAEIDRYKRTNETIYVLYDTNNIAIPAFETVNVSYTISPSEYKTNGHYIVKTWINETCMGFAEFDIHGGLNISISAPPSANVNEKYNVSLKIENILNTPVTNITACALFPPDSNVQGPTNFTISTLSLGESNTTEWSVIISEAGIHNIGFIVFSNDTGYECSYTTIKSISPPELDIEDEYVPFFGEFGEPFGIGFRVKNIGDLNATNVYVEISLPEKVTATNTTWNIANLPGGDEVTLYTDITFNLTEDFVIDVFASDDASHNASGVVWVHLITALAAEFNDVYSDYGVDTDGDGLYNYLTVEVGVNVTTAGTCSIEGWLYDGNGNEIVQADNSTYLNAGNQSVTLNFDGFTIYKHGVDGPYNLSYLKLYDENGTLIDSRDYAYTTSAYSYTDFQHLVALTGNYSDHGTDTDGNGLFDYLTVDVEVILANPGYCIINARLMDSNEEEIVWASNTSHLLADMPQIVQLNFNGSIIYNHGVDGPYYLRDVYIYHTGDPTQPDYVYDAYTTTAYSHVDFEHLMDITPPSVTNPTATPLSVIADDIQESQLTVTVTDESGIASVTVDLSDIGGSPTQEMNNIPGTDVFTVNTTAAVGTALDTYDLQVNATDIYENSNTSVSIALTVTEAVDTTPPTIESVTLDAYTTIPDATIHVTVEATDNVGVTSVTADGTDLVETGSPWEGDITAPSATGDYTLTIRAEDVAENFAETTVDYSVVIPAGGLGVAILPKISSAPAGSTLPLDIKIVSTENFDDVLHVYLTLDGIPPSYQADLDWSDWTDKNVQIPTGGEIVLPITVDIPSGTSPGYKSFGVKVESTKWSSNAQDYGAVLVT